MIDRTIVENYNGFFNESIEFSKYINEKQLLTKLFLYGYDEENVDDCLDEIRSKRMLFNRELRHLYKMASVFIDSYGTNSNNCFRHAADFCFYVRRLLIKELKVFDKLRLGDRRSNHYCFGRLNSLLTNHGQPFLPFIEAEIVKPKLLELANEIVGFSNCIFECIALCRKMMNEEIKIRKDYPRLQWVYERTIAEIFNNGKCLFSNFFVCPDSIEQIEDEMTREMLQTETEKWNIILAKYYHERTPAQLLIHHLILEAFLKKYGFIISDLENKIWGDDRDKIRKIRMMIACFDELEPKGQRDNNRGGIKLSGKWIAKLMHWALMGIDADKKIFVDYFNEKYIGKYQKIGYASIMAVNLSKEEREQCIIEFENFLNRKAEEEKQKTA